MSWNEFWFVLFVFLAVLVGVFTTIAGLAYLSIQS